MTGYQTTPVRPAELRLTTPHRFRPVLVAGEALMVCRRCGEWHDHPIHDPDQETTP